MYAWGTKKEKGFTLLELLIVIAIIVVFSIVVIFAINTARTKARNTTRLSDIKSLQNGFYNGYDSNGGALPSTGGVWACVSQTCYEGWSVYGGSMGVIGFMNTYKVRFPADPKGGTRGYGGYIYHSAWSGGTGYDGTVFSSGAVLNYRVETPLRSDSCGIGKVYTTHANYVDCMLYILP